MVTEDRNKTNVTPVFKSRKKSSELQVDQLQLNPRKGDRATHLGNYFQTHERQKDDWEWPAWNCDGKITFNRHTVQIRWDSLVDEGRAVDFVYLYFSNAFVSHHILIVSWLSTSWTSGPWSGLKTGWTAGLQRLWSAAHPSTYLWWG